VDMTHVKHWTLTILLLLATVGPMAFIPFLALTTLACVFPKAATPFLAPVAITFGVVAVGSCFRAYPVSADTHYM
jgi:hypothetical protein